MEKKIIIIPNYAPLYAWAKAFGPTKAPLIKPTPCPLNVIRGLLLQSGRETLEIYEVVPTDTGYSEPVRLTLENYMKPYDEIVGTPVNQPRLGESSHGSVPDKKPKPVNPTYVDDPKAPVTGDEKSNLDGDNTIDSGVHDELEDELAGEYGKEAPADPETLAESEEQVEQVTADGENTPANTVETAIEPEQPKVDLYAGMTKAERKAARRAAAKEAGQN